MFLFRPHRRLLHEAMKEVKELDSKKQLVEHIKNRWSSWGVHGPNINDETIKVLPYSYDDRIEWNTYIVVYENGDKNHVEGFTNGPVE